VEQIPIPLGEPGFLPRFQTDRQGCKGRAWLRAPSCVVDSGPPSAGEGIPYVDGPPPQIADGFGDETCHKCHFENNFNDPVGSLGLDGVPENYVSGEQYVIEIVIERREIGRGGFQLAARFANGDQAGVQAGSLAPLDERVEVVTEENTQVQYARQTLSGSLPGPEDTTSWSVRWTAPEDAAGPVRFNLAGNASNDDASEFGDFVYTAEALSRPPWLVRHNDLR